VPLLRALLDAPAGEVDVFGEICTLLFAGSDTSAASLGWAMYLLAGAPQLRERLAREAAEVVGATAPTLEAVSRLHATTAFQNEVLRIFPPIPMLSRLAVEADAIGEVAIEPGQKVIVSVIGLHHDARVFPHSRRVSLDRFPGGDIPRQMHGHFLPFGTGRRSCGGTRIANVELTTALTLLARRLQMRHPAADPLGFEWVASLRRRGGQRLELAAA
jgi:cytochrome P450